MERARLAEILARHATCAAAKADALVFVEQAEPARFMASVSGAVAGARNVFLANPSWTAKERSDARAIAVDGDAGESGWLMIPTGGSGGEIKFARHDGSTLSSAVEGFRRHFAMERVSAISVLPLHHVSGFMAWMRCALTGGSFEACSWKDIEAGRPPTAVPERCCISLVPTQLQRLMGSRASVAWLRNFSAILVGGGPAWAELLEVAAGLGLPLAPSYGATETAAMVAAVTPEQFLGGMRGSGMALPHARITTAEGMVRVDGPSVFRGYFPSFQAERTWETEDLGEFGPDGSLRILGRRDDVIVTGGKKVSPGEVETALRASGQFEDVAVVGVPDIEWGFVVVACHPATATVLSMDEVHAALSGLAAFKRPKRFAAISPWPRNAQGKIDRAALTRLAGFSPRQPIRQAP